ncbi:MAG: hypothetical protein ABI156_00825, partial [Caldimonas sp.]
MREASNRSPASIGSSWHAFELAARSDALAMPHFEAERGLRPFELERQFGARRERAEELRDRQ